MKLHKIRRLVKITRAPMTPLMRARFAAAEGQIKRHETIRWSWLYRKLKEELRERKQ